MGKQFFVGVSLTLLQLERFEQAFRQSACHSKSDFIRKKMFDDPVTVIVRNGSLDHFVEIAVKLRRDLLDILSKPSVGAYDHTKLELIVNELITELQKISKSCLPT